ncbi:hypothetical protein GCM10009547_00230 [Sporichthya brevicatena]|uniref:Uncharacterized protein n=1 Tax=Sporichthya brevicatena TaxID=171442 RepID=A0ABP3R367_9ACTN
MRRGNIRDLGGLATADGRRGSTSRWSTSTAEAAVEYLLARPEYLDGALDRLLAEHGSIEAYWAAAGVGPEGLDRLRDVLLQG